MLLISHHTLKDSIKPPYNIKFQFKVNDVVTISKLKTPFHRGWHQTFTNELFIIIKRYKKQGIPHYIIKDYLNRVIDGTFFQNELQLSKINYHSHNFKIDKVLRKKGNKSLVSWIGWPKDYNSWIPNIDIKNLSSR